MLDAYVAGALDHNDFAVTREAVVARMVETQSLDISK